MAAIARNTGAFVVHLAIQRGGQLAGTDIHVLEDERLA